MALRQYQCFRLNTRVCNVPIHLINDELFVFLEDIQDIFGCKIRSFTLNHHHHLPFVRNDRGEREEPLRIRAVIDEIIDCDEPPETGIDQSMHDKIDRVLENTEQLKNKADAILRQTFELAEFTVPRLFIVVPDETTKLNPVNLFRHPYRLFFLCEYEEQRHLAFHEGYEVNQPREFIRKYGPYLKHMLTVVKYAVSVSSVLVPPISYVSPQINVPNILRDKTYWDGFRGKLDQMDDVLDKVGNDEKSDLPPDTSLEGVDLREIEHFLKKKDVNRTLGNLFRLTTSTGNVRWVCIHHYKKFYSDTKRKELQQQLRALDGIVRGDEVTIDEDGVKNFDKILNLMSRGLYFFKLTLRDCTVRESAFDKLLALVDERSYIKYLDLYWISVSTRIGFSRTHREVIEKLDGLVKKRSDLTIKYTVEYPKNKSGLDRDLFDYALKQSTERLILHIYTRDDGKKIVFQDLNKSDLLQMVKSLDQNKTITHCSIGKFNRELSDILLSNTTITNLTIFLVKFKEEKIADLKHFLLKKTCLRALRCSTCENLSPLIRMLSEVLATNIELEVLALNGISEDKQITELAMMLGKNNHLIELNLALDTNIDVQTRVCISQALRANKSLKHLKLTGIRDGLVQQDSTINLYELFFRNTSIEQLTLSFRDHKSNISLFRETIQANENVQILDLSNCNLMTNNKLNGICPIIISNSLVSLSLHSCHFSFEDALDLFQGLIHNKTLTTLSLTNLNIPNSTSDVNLSAELAKMLELNTTLKKMAYTTGKLGDEGAVMIAGALKINQTLEQLNISFNRIGNDGAVALANALTINNALLILNIENNDIKYDDILSIFQSLKTNVTLKHLHIYQSSFKEKPELFKKAKEEFFNINEFIHIY